MQEYPVKHNTGSQDEHRSRSNDKARRLGCAWIRLVVSVNVACHEAHHGSADKPYGNDNAKCQQQIHQCFFHLFRNFFAKVRRFRE